MKSFEDSENFWVLPKRVSTNTVGSLEDLKEVCKLKLSKKVSLQDRIEQKRKLRQKPNLTASYFVIYPFTQKDRQSRRFPKNPKKRKKGL